MEFLCLGQTAASGDAEDLETINQGIRKFQEDPRTKVFYGYAGEWAGVAICEVKSHEELNEYLFLNPLSALTQWQVFPLMHPDAIVKQNEMIAKQQKAA
jgi:muconolactone delta-isomerase